MNRLNTFCCRIPGDINNISLIVRDVINYFEGFCGGIEECALFELKVILNELLLNAIKHGVKEDKSRYVRVIAAIRKDNSVFIMVEDEGSGCDYDIILKNENDCCSNPVYDLCDAKETGRGLLIVKNLCDRIRYNRKGNRVAVVKKLDSSKNPN